MAPIIEQPRQESTDEAGRITCGKDLDDIPGLMAERIGQLYAAEERSARVERTERLIREAEHLH